MSLGGEEPTTSTIQTPGPQTSPVQEAASELIGVARTMARPTGPTGTQHFMMAAGVFFYIFATTYVQSPSADRFMQTHGWAADIVGCLLTTLHVYQTYRKSS